MQHIGVDVSKKQMSRLKNGHSVRVKKGEGLLIVNPQRYDLMSRAFLSGKASTISLTPEEILENTRLINPEAHQEKMGTQLQDNSKLVVPKSTTYRGTPVEKDLSAEGKAELERLLAHKKSVSREERRRIFLKLAKQEKYMRSVPVPIYPLRNPPASAPSAPSPAPEPFTSSIFNAYAPPPKEIKHSVPIKGRKSAFEEKLEKQKTAKERAEAFGELPLGFGIGRFVSNAGGSRTKSGNYSGNYLMESALANVSANDIQEKMINAGVSKARKNMYVVGMGVSSHHRPHTEGVGVGGNIMRNTNPALRPQPFSSSFQLASTLPPSFQRFHNSV